MLSRYVPSCFDTVRFRSPFDIKIHDGFLNEVQSKRGEICTIEKWTRKSGIFLSLSLFHIYELLNKYWLFRDCF